MEKHKRKNKIWIAALTGIIGIFSMVAYFKYPNASTWKEIGGLGVVAVGVLVYDEKNHLKREEKAKRKYFQRKYPLLASNISLLLQSGMSPKSAFLYLASQQKSTLSQTKKEDLLKTELLTLERKLSGGYSEKLAYKEFGDACMEREYQRLMSLVIQYLEQGTKHLSVLLEIEMKDASGARVRSAKQAGEEISTKMLLPMGLLLMDVIAMIIAPVLSTISEFQSL